MCGLKKKFTTLVTLSLQTRNKYRPSSFVIVLYLIVKHKSVVLVGKGFSVYFLYGQ